MSQFQWSVFASDTPWNDAGRFYKLSRLPESLDKADASDISWNLPAIKKSNLKNFKTETEPEFFSNKHSPTWRQHVPPYW